MRFFPTKAETGKLSASLFPPDERSVSELMKTVSRRAVDDVAF
jgi:hypothetical protein